MERTRRGRRGLRRRCGEREDEYYDMVAQTSRKRKQDKEEKYGAMKKAKAENKMVRVVEGEVDKDREESDWVCY